MTESHSYQTILDFLVTLGDQKTAQQSQRFFKTGKGEYGYGDIFLGVRVPLLRQAVKKYREIPLNVVTRLLQSKYHEVRLFALLHMVSSYERGTMEIKESLFELYRRNTRYINNWDLVDSSAPHIIGAQLIENDKSYLYELASSSSIWERRIAIIATLYFIRRHQFEDTLQISEQLLNDSEDLIHKAAGWMLREVGKRDLAIENRFLRQNYEYMPRTMLRYAIEKFPVKERQLYLKGEI